MTLLTVEELIEEIEFLLGTDDPKNLAYRLGYPEPGKMASKLSYRGRHDLAKHFRELGPIPITKDKPVIECCLNGHPKTPENTYVYEQGSKKGIKRCRQCCIEETRRAREKQIIAKYDNLENYARVVEARKPLPIHIINPTYKKCGRGHVFDRMSRKQGRLWCSECTKIARKKREATKSVQQKGTTT